MTQAAPPTNAPRHAHAVDTPRRLDDGILAIAAVILWAGLSWLASGWVAQWREQQEIRRLEVKTAFETILVSGSVNRQFEMLQTVPAIIAQMPTVSTPLSELANDTHPPRAERRKAIAQRFSQQLKALIRHGMVRDIMVLDRHGHCIAAIGWNPSFAQGCYDGSPLAIRDQLATADRIRFLRWPHRWGFLHFVPVTSGNRTVGFIVARIDDVPAQQIVAESETFLTDENGVVLLAHDPTLQMRTMPGAQVNRLSASERQRRYARQHFSPLEIQPAGGPYRIFFGKDRQPRVLITHRILGNNFFVNALREYERAPELQVERLVLFGLVTLIGAMAILLLRNMQASLRRTKRHNREMSRLNAILTEQATTDALTGISNRRHVLAYIESERQRGLRYATPFSLLHIDFDHFKRINDTYGHAAGDEALRQIVHLMRQALRIGDEIGRTGGDEFVVMLPQTALEPATAVAQRMNARVAADVLTLGPHAVHASLSIGVAQWDPAHPETLAELQERADQALYRAKSQGRNQTCAARRAG